MPRLAVILFWSAMSFAFVMALIPLPPHVPGAPSDKVQHILAFAALAALARWAYPGAGLLTHLIGLSAFGALIEIAQAIPALHRDADPVDWLADTAATAAVLALARALRSKAGPH